MSKASQHTVAEVLSEVGFEINLEAFEGLTFDAEKCALSWCKHSRTGIVEASEVVTSYLSKGRVGRSCKHIPARGNTLGHQSLDALRALTSHLLTLKSRPLAVLQDRAASWSSSWETILTPPEDGQSLSAKHTAWLKSLILSNEEMVLRQFVSNLEIKGKYSTVRPPEHEVELVLVSVKDNSSSLISGSFINSYYGPTGMPGVFLAPSYLVRCEDFTVENVRKRTAGGTYYTMTQKIPRQGWYLGDQKLNKPVPLPSGWTPQTLETMAVLAESLPLEAALIAAMEV